MFQFEPQAQLLHGRLAHGVRFLVEPVYHLLLFAVGVAANLSEGVEGFGVLVLGLSGSVGGPRVGGVEIGAFGRERLSSLQLLPVEGGGLRGVGKRHPCPIGGLLERRLGFGELEVLGPTLHERLVGLFFELLELLLGLVRLRPHQLLHRHKCQDGRRRDEDGPVAAAEDQQAFPEPRHRAFEADALERHPGHRTRQPPDSPTAQLGGEVELGEHGAQPARRPIRGAYRRPPRAGPAPGQRRGGAARRPAAPGCPL